MGLNRLDAFLRGQFRKAWRYYSESRRECLKARTCVKCNKRTKLYADHVEPVVDPKTGFQGWDVYYERLVKGKLQAICKSCHAEKTKEENRIRREARKNAKKA